MTAFGPYNDFLQYLLLVSLVVGGVGLLLASAVGPLMATWGLRPVRSAIASQQAFAQNAAHEFRAPLTVVRTAADLALRSGDPREMQQALTTIVRQTEHLDAVVGDLRLLAQGDAGRLLVDSEPLNLALLVSDVCDEVQPAANDLGILLQLHVPPAVIVRGDALRLRQLLLILIDNALKHGASGGSIGVSLEQRFGKAALTVQDSGSGIEPRHLPYIFDRFYRAETGRSGDPAWSGLGLAIAREIVEAHRGKITAGSELGTGTWFRVTLPTTG